jgi:predicted nucleotidyltransferase
MGIFGSRAAELVLRELNEKGSGHASGLARRVGISLSQIQRQLQKLEKLGLVVSETVANARMYKLNPASPVMESLRDLLDKLATMGELGSASTKALRLDDVRRLLKKNRKLLNRHHIKRLYVFGSTARDQARSDSDLDLVAEYSAPIGLSEAAKVREELESLFHKKVDLVSFEALKPDMKAQVRKEMRLVT